MYWIRHNWTPFSILVLVFAAGWMIFTPPTPDAVTGGKIPAPQVGFLAPDFALQDAAGQTMRLSNLRGKPVLVNLWASWCAPCKAEMPAMQKVYDTYSARGLEILAVNTTFQDDAASAQQFADGLGLRFPILFDVDGSVSRSYMVRSMPTSFFVAPDGTVRRVVIGGPMSEALLRAEIEPLLEEAR
jgi:peroxiredoxin